MKYYQQICVQSITGYYMDNGSYINCDDKYNNCYNNDD